ncbi:MAG: ATP-binding protein [Candidatus Binatia bacterium]
MSELIETFFSAGFMPHGHCFFWRAEILWLHVVSDVLIALAYFSIPASLFYFARRRKDWPFLWTFYLFGAFIVACGVTHLMGVWTMWVPSYGIEGLLKAATAAISLTTAVAILPVVPKAIALRSPDELTEANRELERQVAERADTESELRRKTSLLELLKEVAIAANEASEVTDAVRTCIEKVCAFTGWPVGHAYLKAGEGTAALASSGLWHLADPERYRTFRQITEATKFNAGEGLPGRVLATGKPEWIVDVAADPDFARTKWADDIGVKSGFAFPIFIGAEVGGVLEFFSPQTREPDEPLLEALTNVGAQIGRVVERKRSERELALARDAALEASRLKSAFLANMSHEIRTPLNIILGYNAIIAERFPAESPERALLDGIDRASNRLMETIHGILDLSKIETRTFRIDPVAIDLPALLRKQADDFEVLAREKGLPLTCEIDESEAAILFDEYCLSNSLMNLIQNAIKFTEKGGVHLRIFRDADWTLCLEVRDTGIGIDPAYLPRIFAPFSQEEAGYTRRFEGSGLGLALTRNYLELNHAQLTVKSKKGKGSVFTVRFSKGSELWLTDTASSGPAGPGSERSLAEAGRQPKPVVLVVEDDPDTLLYMKTLLQSRYEVVIAQSGAEVRHRMEERGRDIRMVLMDLSLRGEEDGLMITKYLRGLEHRKDLPIIAVTAHAFPEDRLRALAAGCNGYLSKPFEHNQLLTMMDDFLSPGRAHGHQNQNLQ